MGGQLTSCAHRRPSCACADKEMARAPRPMLEKYPQKRKRRDMKKLQDEVDEKKTHLDQIKSTAVDLSPKLSLHDAELVADQIRDLERRYGELENSIRRKRQGYTSLGSDIDAIKEEADRYLVWLDQCEANVQEDVAGQATESVNKRLEKMKDLETELSQRQMTLDNVGQKAQNLVADLPSQEKDKLETLLATVQTKHNELYGSVSNQCRVLETTVDQRTELKERIDKLNKWMDEREAATEPFDTIRLLAVHVEKQLDKCKSLGAKIQNQKERVNEVATQAQALQEESTEEEKQEMDTMVQELVAKHEKLAQRVKDQQNNLRDCCSSRKSFEGDCQKIERWCKETEMQTQTEVPPDCAVEVLEEQHKVYKNLENSVQLFSSLVSETKEKGNGFFPTLYEADKPQLQKQLDALDARFQGVSSSVEDRIQQLGDMVDSRSQTRNQIDNAEQWLRDVQEELKQSNTPIGHTSQDAELVHRVFESIEEKLENYRPNMDELEKMGERMREENQVSQADDIHRLSLLYNSLLEQSRQHMESVSMAIGARRSYEQLMNTQEELVKEQDEVVNNIMSCGLPLNERIATLKNVIDCLQNQDAELNVAKDKARQIGKQGSEDDFNTVVGQVDSLKDKVKDLKSQAQGLIDKCENIQRGRQDFEAAVFDMVSWFEEKEDVLATCQSLHVDPNNIEPAIEKHKATSVEAVDKMQAMKDRMTQESVAFEEMQEAPTQEFSEKMEQIKALESTLLSAISKKEQYLTEAQADRKQYDNSMKQVSEWLRGAETLLDSGYEGLDLDTLESTLNDFTDYFSEASLCQDEIEQVMELSERLLPTLDDNDSATMKQSMSNVNRKFINVTAASQSKQAMMEHKTEQWKEFQRSLLDMNAKLDVLESEWVEVEKSSDTSPDAVLAHLEMVKGFLAHVETSRPQVDNLNELARDLDRVANTHSRDIINQRITALNQRWDTLTGGTENRIMALETIGNQWGDFATMISSIKTIVHDSENKLRIANVDAATEEELKSELENLKDIEENLERVEPQISRMQSSRLSLQQALPTAEAKISSQEEFMKLVEDYERLTQTVQSETDRAQEEYDERHSFMSEMDKSIAWFQDSLENIKGGQSGGLHEDMANKLNKHRIHQHEVESEIEKNTALEKAQEARYSALGKELPFEMTDKLEELHALEEQVLVALREKEEELLHIKEDREEYNTTLQAVILWLQKTDMQLQEPIKDIPEAQQAHQVLLLEFDEFKPKLDHLRNKGGDIIRHSSDPQEKQNVQKTLADVNRQWLSLQAQAADKTQELSEASDLANAIDDVANSVTIWAEQAHAVLDEDLQLTNFDRLKDQLKTYRKLKREVDPNQDKVIALNAMVKQLEQVCSSPANMTKVGELKQTVNAIETKSDVQLSALEEANKRMEEFEREVGDLMNWLEQTRARMTMRDTTRDLKDQLAVQEVRRQFPGFRITMVVL